MNLLETINSQTMSSREIAKLTGKRHDHVLRDIRNMFESLDIQSPQNWVDYKDSKGRIFQECNLPKRETLILVSGYSVTLRAKIIDRWAYLESKLSEKFDWKGERIGSKDLHKQLAQAIHEAHEEPKPYHYSNESDMINRVVLGCTAKSYREMHDIKKTDPIRDTLTTLELKAINDLQLANKVYIEDGLSFDERKKKLNSLFDRKHKDKLIKEFHLLNS